jgi:hypothetical protein
MDYLKSQSNYSIFALISWLSAYYDRVLDGLMGDFYLQNTIFVGLRRKIVRLRKKIVTIPEKIVMVRKNIVTIRKFFVTVSNNIVTIRKSSVTIKI